MNIGEKIKRIRQHRRMTQKELGELVDLSANRIAQYEMGYRVFTWCRRFGAYVLRTMFERRQISAVFSS